jgi:hypothetical protein
VSANITIDVREFTETIRKYAEVSKKDEKEVVADRAGKLAFEFWKSFKALTPPVSLLKGLPDKLGYRIKRKFEGSTVKQEIARRINARMAAASGWLPSVRRFSRGKVTLKKKNVKGRFEINLSEPSVTIINEMKEAVAADKLYPQAMQNAINAQTKDMEKYIERKLEQRAKEYSA